MTSRIFLRPVVSDSHLFGACLACEVQDCGFFCEITSGSVSALSLYAWFNNGYTFMSVYGGFWHVHTLSM